MNQDETRCPKCASNKIHVDKKGFSAKKAVAGAILVGGIGLTAGAIGQNKIIITCLNCGNQFNPGEHLKGTNEINEINEIEGVSYVGPEERRLYLCKGCGKQSSLGQNKACPRCGRMLNETNIIDLERDLKESNIKFWVIVMAIITTILLIISII